MKHSLCAVKKAGLSPFCARLVVMCKVGPGRGCQVFIGEIISYIGLANSKLSKFLAYLFIDAPFVAF
jgi:hypothetical protein